MEKFDFIFITDTTIRKNIVSIHADILELGTILGYQKRAEVESLLSLSSRNKCNTCTYSKVTRQYMAKSKKKRESFTRLTVHERSVIEVRYCGDGTSLRAIARELGRSVSTVMREVGERSRKGTGRYSALRAQREADTRIQRSGRKRCMDHTPLYRYVKKRLKDGWSPEQISMRLVDNFPDDERMRISHEAIYTYIYNQINRNGHGSVKKGKEDLRVFLPRKRKRRIAKGMRKATENRERIHPTLYRAKTEDCCKKKRGRTLGGRHHAVTEERGTHQEYQ